MRSSKIYQLESHILFLESNAMSLGAIHLKTTLEKIENLKREIEELRIIDQPQTVGEYYQMMKHKNLI